MNDTWQIYGVSKIFQPDSKIYIFNRFGKLIKEISPSEKGWDGTLNGKKLPTDDYWFQVTLQDGRMFKSHFTLKY
jgi:gliding motility-associated-like protein